MLHNIQTSRFPEGHPDKDDTAFSECNTCPKGHVGGRVSRFAVVFDAKVKLASSRKEQAEKRAALAARKVA